jgi:hypothetical protein
MIEGLLWIVGALALVGVVWRWVPPGVRDRVTGPPATPPALGAFGDDPPVESAEFWRARRAPMLRNAFQSSIYGRMPSPIVPKLEARRMIDPAAFHGAARIEQLTISLDPDGGAQPMRFNMMLATPLIAGPHPVVLMATFCGNRKALGERYDDIDLLSPIPRSCERPPTGSMIRAFMGRYLSGPPLERIIRRGYAAAIYYAGDVVPDDPERAKSPLARLAGDTAEGERPGALAAWAWLYSRALDVLEAEPAINAARVAVLGHSRHGKAALLASAFDERITAVIAHQSGKGGATLTRSHNGESVKQIIAGFPHWFAANFSAFADAEAAAPVDQHQLLALIAPRAVLLGNGRLDRWADPEGSQRAALGADPVHRLLGASGLTQRRMAAMDPAASLSVFLRPGVHGITGGDWSKFLDFMDAHLKARP